MRYTAYALALELGWWDVDAMLDSMTYRQFQEWLAFYRIRNSKDTDRAKGSYDESPEGRQRMANDLKATMEAFQTRRNNKKAG